MKRILFMPPEPWYVEVHMEYLIRYFGGKYFMEQGYPCDVRDMTCEESIKRNPMMRNPDDFDLLIPLLPSHPKVDANKYKEKLAAILWEPNEGCWRNTKIVAATTPMAAQSMEAANHPYVAVTPGIDTKLFKPFSQVRENDLMQIGVIGCPHNERHRVKQIIKPLFDIPGVEFKFYVRNWLNRENDTAEAGGDEFHKRICSGNKYWPGVPNIYNRMDVLLKVDADPGLTFPILEAAACGVPFVATHVGIESLFEDAGAGIVCKADVVEYNGNGRSWYRDEKNTPSQIERIKKGIEFMRDNSEKRKEMGENGRKEILKNWTWEAQLPKWAEFFERALS